MPDNRHDIMQREIVVTVKAAWGCNNTHLAEFITLKGSWLLRNGEKPIAGLTVHISS